MSEAWGTGRGRKQGPEYGARGGFRARKPGASEPELSGLTIDSELCPLG